MSVLLTDTPVSGLLSERDSQLGDYRGRRS